MAVRQGAPGSVTSNLHGGGHAEDAESFLRGKYGTEAAKAIVATAREIALRVPDVLEQYHGRLAELGVDLGVDADGKVWILEANSKPGRSAFAALSGETASIALPEMVVTVSRADPDAVAVAKQLGFKVVVTPRAGKK